MDYDYGELRSCNDISLGAIAAILAIAIMVALAAFMLLTPSQNKIMKLGDEVATTDEYNTLFNDSFSGRIISIAGGYTVRDENGNERTFVWKWIDHVDTEGDI